MFRFSVVKIFIVFVTSISVYASTYTNCKDGESCIRMTMCQGHMNLIKSLRKPLQPEAVKILRKQECGFDGSYPMVCCLSSGKTDETSTDQIGADQQKVKNDLKDKIDAFNTAFVLSNMDYFFVRRMLEEMTNNTKH